MAKSLQTWAQGQFTLEGKQFSYKGKELPFSLNERIIEMATRGEAPTPFFNFWERLQKNPSFRSVNQLWDFLKHEGIPLLEDGCFLAYKSVRSDYMDHHSGQWSNKPGTTNQMPRNEISDDPKVECHEGFHVGALGYASSFGGSSSKRIIVCKIDPEDVVCVPYDSSQQKMRVCKYTVIGNHNDQALPSTTYVADEYDVTDEDRDEEGAEPAVTRVAEPKGKKGDEEVTKKEKPKVTSTPVKVPTKFNKYQEMGMDKLMQCSIEELRQYAGKGLQIIGASKIPGGKTALVSKILGVRS